jgi:phospholipid-binding lipoprotein MlaA
MTCAEPSRRPGRRRAGTWASLVFALGLSACASIDQGAGGVDSANDPLEPLNRAVFQVNQAVDTVIIRPVTVTYQTIVPDPAQQWVTNLLRTLRQPIVLANELLQGDWEGAEVAAARLALNTTLGLGFIDIAAEIDPRYAWRSEDFGQTLAVWGVGEGPYLVLPIIGPSNPRDATGLAVDWFADPYRLGNVYDQERVLNYTRIGLAIVDQRSQSMAALDEIERSSVDFYASIRSLYRQLRAAEIRDGAPAETDSFDIPDFEDEPAPEEAPVDDVSESPPYESMMAEVPDGAPGRLILDLDPVVPR